MPNKLRLESPGFLHLLPQEIINKLTQAGSVQHFHDKQLIHSRGDYKPGLSLVLSGTVYAAVGDPDGRLLIAGMLGEGHCFGEFTLFAELPRTHDISAVGATEILQIPAGTFIALFDAEPKIAQALMKSTLLRMHLLLEILDAMRRLPLIPRTAKILLTMLYSSGMLDYVPCKQSELADTLGVTRISLGKALKALQEKQLIKLGYGKIHFPDTHKFEQWVERECQGTAMR